VHFTKLIILSVFPVSITFNYILNRVIISYYEINGMSMPKKKSSIELVSF